MNFKSLYTDNKSLSWGLVILASLSFLTTLGLPYVGEEAVYTISSYEMWYHQSWIAPTIYGGNYARPPLFNWFMIPLANVIGWDNILVAARIVTIFATLGMAAVLYGFVKQLFKNNFVAIFSVLAFLAGDLLFRRGWIAYADPIFSFFVFTSIVCLWFALERSSAVWILLAGICLAGSFLSKAITGYAFYGTALVVMFAKHPNRKYLLSPAPMLLHLAALAFPFLWSLNISQGAHGGGMVSDVLTKFSTENFLTYFFQTLIYPVETLGRFLPLSALVLYYWFKKGGFSKFEPQDSIQKARDQFVIPILLWIVVLNYIPYWLSPQNRIRYLLPLYPFISLLFAYAIYRFGQKPVKVALVWLGIGIFLKYVAGFWYFPFYEKTHRGSYMSAAEDILSITKDQPLYASDDSSSGLSVVANINRINRLAKDRPPLVRPKAGNKGYIISYVPDVIGSKLVKSYAFGGDKLYLVEMEPLDQK